MSPTEWPITLFSNTSGSGRAMVSFRPAPTSIPKLGHRADPNVNRVRCWKPMDGLSRVVLKRGKAVWAELSHILRRRSLFFAVMFAVTAAGIWGCIRHRAASRVATLSESDQSLIRQQVERHTSLPVRSITPMPGGTVSVFVGENALGGMQFVVLKVDGEWRLSGKTLFY